MGAKGKNKSSNDRLKAGDIIETDKGESFELDKEQADSLNKQIEDGENADDNSKDESKAQVSKNTGNFNKVNKRISGTFRFNKFKGK